MVVFKETLKDCTILGILEMVYSFPVIYYIWDEREMTYDYTDFEHLPDQFRVTSISLKYSLKIISVFIQNV